MTPTPEQIKAAHEWCSAGEAAKEWACIDIQTQFVIYTAAAAYAAHCVAEAVAEKDAEIERLRAALEMMEADARGASLYCSICGSCGEEGCGCTHKCVYAFAHPDVSERLAKLETIVEAARDLAKEFKGDPCRFDHHGYCQSHFLEEDCSVERLLKALSALDGEKEAMTNLCQLCGEPMPEGEELFHYHGYSGPCPKPPLKEEKGLTVIEEIAVERKRQIEVEGWTAEHDDQHTMKELADAASCYATNTPYNWPNSWSICWWKPTDHRRNLVKAAALIVAEIERIDRLEKNP